MRLLVVLNGTTGFSGYGLFIQHGQSEGPEDSKRSHFCSISASLLDLRVQKINRWESRILHLITVMYLMDRQCPAVGGEAHVS